MNYKRQYDLLIEKARQRGTVEGYKERHHIIPRCMDGDDEKENLVELTAREHYVAHRLLYMQHKSSETAHAWFSMLRISENQERQFTSRQYERAKLAMATAVSKRLKKDNPMQNIAIRQVVANHLRSPEQRKRIQAGMKPETNRKRSESMKRWLTSSEGKSHQQRRIHKMTGKPRSASTILKCSIAQKGKPKPKVQCSICGVFVDKGNLARYHKHT